MDYDRELTLAAISSDAPDEIAALATLVADADAQHALGLLRRLADDRGQINRMGFARDFANMENRERRRERVMPKVISEWSFQRALLRSDLSLEDTLRVRRHFETNATTFLQSHRTFA